MKSKSLAVVTFLMLFLARGAYAQNQYYLSHVADGNFGDVSFRTTFILFNNTDANVVAILELTDNTGNPLTVTLGGLGSGSQFTITLGAGATSILQTDGSGNQAVGAATVTATAAIGVSAIFTIYDASGNYMTEAGVGNSSPVTEFVLPVDSTGFFLTGLGLFNPGSSDASITMTLFNTSGIQVDRTTQPLGRGAHSALFLAAERQLFPTVSNFRGTVLVQSSVPIAALVLRQYKTSTQLSYTSLPTVPHSSTKLTLNLAHVANGNYGSISFKTSFLIFNISTSPANVALALTKDDGSQFTTTIPGTGTNSTFNLNLAAGGSVFLQTDGLGAGTTGAATITSNVPVGASAIFTVYNTQGQFQTEAGVGDAPVLTSLTLPVDITGTYDTGVAFFNPGNTSTTLTLKLLDANGVLASSMTQPLAAKNHLATFVDNLFPGTSNFRGSLAISAAAGVSATTLRQNSVSPSYVTYTTLPTASGTATGKTAAAPLLSKTETGIDATSNLTMNETLPPGFKLSGTISGPGKGTAVVASAGQSNIFSGPVNQQTGKYLIVLPSGTYNLTVSFTPNGVPSGQDVSVTSSVSGSVQVSGDTTRDITLPSVALFTVSGTVNGLSNLSSPAGMQIVFTSNDRTIEADSSLAANGSYQGVLPAGTYTAGLTASITFPPSMFQNQSLGILNLGSASISGNTTIPAFTVPATARLSGTIHGADSPVIGVIVSATGPSASVTSSSSADMLTAQYQMILPKNTTYGVDVSMLLVQGTTSLGAISFPIPAQSLSLGADTANYDFTVPALPGRVTISGRVTDSGGNPVSGAIVNATSKSITGTPNLEFSTFVQTDASGNYSMSVLSGTNYTLIYFPPAPQP